MSHNLDVFYYYSLFNLLEVQVQTKLEATWTWVWVLINTIGNFRIKSLILGDNERVLNGEVNTTVKMVLQQVGEGVT
jgi:hypothetical protein